MACRPRGAWTWQGPWTWSWPGFHIRWAGNFQSPRHGIKCGLRFAKFWMPAACSSDFFFWGKRERRKKGKNWISLLNELPRVM